MDIASIIGFAGGLIIVFVGAVTSGLPILGLIDIPSVIITFGGTAAGLIMALPLSQFLSIPKYFSQIFSVNTFNIPETINMIVASSEKARRDGLLALEDEIEQMADPFLKKALQLIVDGTDPELVRTIMEIEMDALVARHGGNRGIMDLMGGFGPSFGMLGTLIGLVAMLGNLGAGDPAMIGKGMGVALITSLYGSILANVVAIPAAGKMKGKTEEEVMVKQILLEGVLSIQSGDNPRIVKEKLTGFLSPAEKKVIEAQEPKE